MSLFLTLIFGIFFAGMKYAPMPIIHRVGTQAHGRRTVFDDENLYAPARPAHHASLRGTSGTAGAVFCGGFAGELRRPLRTFYSLFHGAPFYCGLSAHTTGAVLFKF